MRSQARAGKNFARAANSAPETICMYGITSDITDSVAISLEETLQWPGRSARPCIVSALAGAGDGLE